MIITINNPQIEDFFINELKSDVKAFSDFILKNLEQYKQQKEFDVTPLDPAKHSYKLEFDGVDDIKESDNPFANVEDVAIYAKDLREKSWR